MTKARKLIRQFDRMNKEYMRYLIAENWQKDLDELTDDLLELYTYRLFNLFMDDQDHISLHDLAYALCEHGLDANDETIYGYVQDMRY